MAKPTDINRNTTIIQGRVIMAIGTINSVSNWGSPALRSELQERNANVPEYDDDRYPRGFGD
jgi:hypothetical protein